MLKLFKALRLSASPAVAFTGAGGKTTAMLRLAQELSPAIITTTTHLGSWQARLADQHFVWEAGGPLPDIEGRLGRGVTLVTGPLQPETDRYPGLSLPQMDGLRELAGYHDLPLLIEADGARQKALKAPAAHEPVIPKFVALVVVVAGMSSLREPLNWENIHRPEVFAQIAGIGVGDPLTPVILARVLSHPQGGLKGIPPQEHGVALLNQADTPELQAAASEIAQSLISNALISPYQAVIVASLAPPAAAGPSILAVHENVAGIILAAGESQRFGRTKQLLDYHGRPFVRAVAEKALAAGLEPVVVVTGCDAEAVEAAVAGLPVQTARNPDWPSGQASSIRAGLTSLAASGRGAGGQGQLRVGAAIFLLADMPQVTPEVLRALVEGHVRELPAVLAPMVEDRRANPTLFDRLTFPDLMRLTGDVGGRAIFSKHSPAYLPWLDDGLLRDVDTPEDYEKLTQYE